jgi:hypothetical protein
MEEKHQQKKQKRSSEKHQCESAPSGNATPVTGTDLPSNAASNFSSLILCHQEIFNEQAFMKGKSCGRNCLVKSKALLNEIMNMVEIGGQVPLLQ